MTDTKTCNGCATPLTRDQGETSGNFKRRKFCRGSCRMEWMHKMHTHQTYAPFERARQRALARKKREALA